jgi:hypothetical protein
MVTFYEIGLEKTFLKSISKMFKKMFTDDEILNFINSRAFIKNYGGIIILYQFSDNVLLRYDRTRLISITASEKMMNHYKWIEKNII